MEELLASQTKKLITLSRGQQVEGEVVSQTPKEIILDLGTKSEGVIQARDLSDEQRSSLKIGDKLKAFVVALENESGQVVLSLQKSLDNAWDRRAHLPAGRHGLRGGSSRGGKFSDWNRFIQAQNQKIKLQAAVLEVNKGGLIVEADGVRGFLPNSQVGFELISKAGAGMENLIGQTLSLTVIEVDPTNNKLIFTQRGQVSDELKNKLKEFKNGQKSTGKIVAVLPFGLVVDIAGVEGLVFISDVAWEKVEDLSKMFKAGAEIDVVVIGIDEELGRLNLSIKRTTADPFAKLVDKYPADEAVKAEVISVSDAGVMFKLADGAEGLLPAAKMESGLSYEAGKSMTVLIDSVDAKRRKINLAPFITSTEGLIYK